MEEYNKDKKISFWSTNIKWTPKRLILFLIFIVLFLLDRFFGDAIAHSPQGPLVFNISLGVAWIAMLLNTIWIFKKGEQSYSTAMRTAMVVMVVFFFCFTLGHYLGYF